MDNIEEIAGSLASIEEICKYIQEHNIDKKGIIENRKFQEKLYRGYFLVPPIFAIWRNK